MELPEIPVPNNPNAVVFATGAAQLFAGRSWGSLLRLASQVVHQSSQGSQNSVLVGFAWRAMLDRKNQTLLQGMLYAVMDGSVTREQLSQLESSVDALDLGFNAPCIERIPPAGAHAVIASSGRLYGLVLREEGRKDPVRRSLHFQEGRVMTAIDSLQRLSAEDMGGLDVAIAIPAHYGPEQQESERLRLAYALGITERIVAADGTIDPQETEWIGEFFPPDLLAQLGMNDPDIRAEYFDAACTTLPSALGHHDKFALVGLFFSACFSDGRVDAREMRVLKDAAEQLGLTKEEVVKYLQRFW